MPEPERPTPPPADPARLLDACREPVLQVTPDGRAAYANAAARNRLGLADGMPLADRLDPPSRADLDALLVAYRRDGAFPEGDRAWTWTRPDGQTVATRVGVANLWDGSRVAGFVATVRRGGDGDADRRRAEEIARAVVMHA